MFLNGLGARLPARRPPAVLRARARDGAQGRRRRAGDRRADGLPARLRRRVRRGDRDRRDRRRRARARAPARRSPPSSTATSAETLRALAGGRRRRHERRGSRACAAIETEKRAAEREQLADAARAAAPDARVRRARAACSTATRSSIGDGGDFVSYAGRVVDSYEPGCWLDPGPFGCLGSRPGLRAGRQARASRAPGRAAARRRRLRLLRDGVRHARAPRRATSSA